MPAMIDHPPRVPSKFRRCPVSAIRDFPKGCGNKITPNFSGGDASSSVAAGSSSIKIEESKDANLIDLVNVGAENGVKLKSLVGTDECLTKCGNGDAENGAKIKSPLEVLAAEGVTTDGHMAECSMEYVNGNAASVAACSLRVANRIDPGNASAENVVYLECLGESQKIEGVNINGYVNVDAKERCIGERFVGGKRRKVWAVRDFPPGCGRVASKIRENGSSDARPVPSSGSKAFDCVRRAVGPSEERVNGDCNAKDSVMGESCKKALDDRLKKQSETDRTSVENVEGGTESNAGKRIEVKVVEEATVEFLEVKRAGEMACEEAGMDGKCDVTDSVMGEDDREKKKVTSCGVSSVENILGEPESNASKQIEIKVTEERIVQSPKVKSPGEEEKPLKTSAEMSELNTVVDNKGMISEEEATRGSGTVPMIEIVGTEAEKETERITENSRDSSSEVRVNSPLQSSSRESTLDSHGKKKTLIQYSSKKKKLAMHDVKQEFENLQVKESQDAKASSGVEIVDKVESNSDKVDKSTVDKAPVDISEDTVNPKRKSPEAEVDVPPGSYAGRQIVFALMAAQNCPWRNGRRSVGSSSRSLTPKVQAKRAKKLVGSSSASVTERTSAALIGNVVDLENEDDSPSQGGGNEMALVQKEEGNASLESYADREIVYALMAAENCPWRNGRKSGGKVSRSVTPKVRPKRVKKLASNFASTSGKTSTAILHNIIDLEDDEDSLPRDGGNEMALAIYKGSHDLCITMTPSVPSELVPMGSSSHEAVSRNMVKKTLRMFQLICRKLVQEEEKKSKGTIVQEEDKSKGKLTPEKEANSKENGKNRIDLKVAGLLKSSNQWVNHGEPIIGHVPGVEIGDEFHYRVELSIIGLHRLYQAGIDFAKIDGSFIAMSIVASGGYPDDMDSSDVLIYSGSGEGNQKLERGNLALKNNIDAQKPVRVIYGSKEFIKRDPHDTKPKLVATFTYDGLYMVENYWSDVGDKGFNVFKFQLRRIPGQPEIALREIKKAKKSKVREGLCLKDISDGKESRPICAVNTVDSELPMPFNYMTKVTYPSWYAKKPPKGCDCTDGCSDSEKCACAVKNGGEIPFNFSGAIVQAKPLVYECGPSCKCPPSCHNRVSQHGIKLRLEIFKTSKRGWGVRSLNSIPSGTFVCEYVGEMLEDAAAELRVNDEYLFDIGHNYDDHTLWEGLPSCIPGLQSDAASEPASKTMMDVGFTIDAAESGNVGRFINHSCSPNLYAQNLLYDHDDKKMPHVMFFAVDNIPPLQELTYHYNYSIDQVRDSEGNIKKKECFCGSSECTGRLY